MSFLWSAAWPLPAVFTWAISWVIFMALRGAGLQAPLAFVLVLPVAALLAWRGSTGWRRLFMLGGFPLSLLLSGAAAGWPAWLWLLPLLLLLLLYPMNAWRDAPLFPTPAGALRGLAAQAPLPPGAAVLDAGCGLGDGLRALRLEYPQARLQGWEWSWPLAQLCRLRCPFAQVRRADIWSCDWSGQDLVYLFQRPESMARALDKAQRELRPGAWLVSLEFEATGWRAQACLQAAAGKPVWLYQAPLQRR